jgi:methyltransferase
MHASWLAGLWLLAADHAIDRGILVLFVLLQLGRLWVLATLGRRWTTRVVAVKGEALVRSGPYRLLRHPNYWIVAAEIAAVPLALGLPIYAAIFSVLNAVLLRERIRVENAALAWTSF